MEAMGTNPLLLLLDGAAQARPHLHYPVGDVYDAAHHTQFYYHVHRDGEVGHIHLFQRARGMQAGLAPLHPNGDANAPCHLVAVGLGADGNAVELFTTNRWVTGEAWYPAAAVKAMLTGFCLETPGRLRPVALWLGALLDFYRPVVETLIDQRDAAIAARAESNPLDDGALEVLSRIAVDPRKESC
jgi:hypothetical protein